MVIFATNGDLCNCGACGGLVVWGARQRVWGPWATQASNVCWGQATECVVAHEGVWQPLHRPPTQPLISLCPPLTTPTYL